MSERWWGMKVIWSFLSAVSFGVATWVAGTHGVASAAAFVFVGVWCALSVWAWEP
jgi:hypothetical protein